MRNLGIVLLVILLFTGGELLITYRGWYSPPPLRAPDLSELRLPTYPTPPSIRGPVEERAGVLLLDTLHFNFFFEGEMEPFLQSIAQRGYQVDFFGDRLALKIPSAQERRTALEAALRRADSYVVVLPFLPFEAGEIDLVQKFVAQGGKLLVVSDPTRPNQTNSLASAFGINFETDYLYNVREHETNYRNVFFRDFARDDLTQGLDAVVLYTASSISGSSAPLILADAGTRSSMREGEVALTPMVRHPSGQVVAISDFTFMLPTYSGGASNGRLIENLADFLTTSTRRFTLTEFPSFFKGDVDIVMTSRQALAEATRMKSLLASSERDVRSAELAEPQKDTVFIGLYEDLAPVRPLLRAGGIDMTDSAIETPFAPPVDKEGSGVVYLDVRDGRQALIVLADTIPNLAALVQQIESGEFRKGLVADNVGLYQLAPRPKSPSGG
ncbi:MAG: hypothetical protein HY685_06290 [Chloroflexi bacterium]|nr:hypothetical protein [Chloroflexota bacterium]